MNQATQQETTFNQLIDLIERRAIEKAEIISDLNKIAEESKQLIKVNSEQEIELIKLRSELTDRTMSLNSTEVKWRRAERLINDHKNAVQSLINFIENKNYVPFTPEQLQTIENIKKNYT